MLGITKTKNLSIILAAYLKKIEKNRYNEDLDDFLVIQSAYLEARRYAEIDKIEVKYQEPYVNFIAIIDSNQKIKLDENDNYKYETNKEDKRKIDEFWQGFSNNIKKEKNQTSQRFFKRLFESQYFFDFQQHIYFQEKFWSFFSNFNFYEAGMDLVVNVVFPNLYRFNNLTSLSLQHKYDTNSLLKIYLYEVNIAKRKKIEDANNPKLHIDWTTRVVIYFVLLVLYIALSFR